MGKVTQALIALLMLDAAWVAFLLANRRDAWAWIVVYWLILTLKNALDCIGRWRDR